MNINQVLKSLEDTGLVIKGREQIDKVLDGHAGSLKEALGCLRGKGRPLGVSLCRNEEFFHEAEITRILCEHGYSEEDAEQEICYLDSIHHNEIREIFKPNFLGPGASYFFEDLVVESITHVLPAMMEVSRHQGSGVTHKDFIKFNDLSNLMNLVNNSGLSANSGGMVKVYLRMFGVDLEKSPEDQEPDAVRMHQQVTQSVQQTNEELFDAAVSYFASKTISKIPQELSDDKIRQRLNCD